VENACKLSETTLMISKEVKKGNCASIRKNQHLRRTSSARINNPKYIGGVCKVKGGRVVWESVEVRWRVEGGGGGKPGGRGCWGGVGDVGKEEGGRGGEGKRWARREGWVGKGVEG